MGMSMVITHTSKAENLWNQVKEEGVWFTCERENVQQPRLLTPTAVAKERGLFMILYKALPFSVLMRLVDLVLELKRKKF